MPPKAIEQDAMNFCLCSLAIGTTLSNSQIHVIAILKPHSVELIQISILNLFGKIILNIYNMKITGRSRMFFINGIPFSILRLISVCCSW